MKNGTSKRISAINALIITAVSLLSIAAIAIPSARAASALLPADQCDAEAGSEHDLQRNLAFRPVATEDIRIGIALSACREAYNQGSGPRQTFELARVLHAAGQRGQAMAMLEKAAEGNHAIAMVNYAVMLGERGDHAAEFALYQKAAAAGNILAAYNLGVAYRDGIGTSANGKLAAQWFERASVARDNLGAFNLAVMLDEGTQIAEDNRKAAQFYRLAADRGNVDAMVNLGLMLESGEGMTADTAAAREMFARAAAKGDVFAQGKIVPAIDTATTAGIDPGEQANLVLAKTIRLK
ncbi:sel1 repeat family protein [Pararhizobium sp. YC-54]|uniref:tetratricopeptide repeat protein n=1 Tax=Pararhizobium sp. YC-54 TaxID=2986920 RepID=UPI0021F7F24B|nr:tetratricopeptide repeat protein [Pararhizobium sp. YC-54]MCV9998988.1 sel1 repeat family protein [Pararhizobium sp. YC-54]